MSNFGAFVHHALRRAYRVITSPVRHGRWPLAFAVVASLLVSALEASSAAHADPPPDPAARVQIVLKEIHVVNDRDGWGNGEMRVHVSLCPFDGADNPCESGDGVEATYDFHASSGETIPQNRVVPASGDTTYGEASPEIGVPLYAAKSYVFSVSIFEMDPVGGDDMGRVGTLLGPSNNWGIGGTYKGESDHSSNGGVNRIGDYSLTYEIRQTPLPDLLLRGIRLVEAPDGQQYCATVQNVGQRPSPPAAIAVRADGAFVTAHTLPGLDVDQATEYCVSRAQLPAQRHLLGFIVDEFRQVPELDETNNHYEWRIEALASAAAAPSTEPASSDPTTAPPSSPKPDGDKPAPSGEKADLVMRAIRVNGQPPTDPDACKIGKNVVTATVKNVGAGDAAAFTLDLSVDDHTLNATVDGLGADQERDIRFDAIALRKGLHTLRAAVDAEPKEDNNELKVAVTCKGD